MSLYKVPATTEFHSQASFSLISCSDFIPWCENTLLGPYSKTLYLTSNSVKFQTNVAMDDRNLVTECRVIVKTQSHCFGLRFSSFFTLTSPSMGKLVRVSGQSLSGRTLTQVQPPLFLRQPHWVHIGGYRSVLQFPKT